MPRQARDKHGRETNRRKGHVCRDDARDAASIDAELRAAAEFWFKEAPLYLVAALLAGWLLMTAARHVRKLQATAAQQARSAKRGAKAKRHMKTTVWNSDGGPKRAQE